MESTRTKQVSLAHHNNTKVSAWLLWLAKSDKDRWKLNNQADDRKSIKTEGIDWCRRLGSVQRIIWYVKFPFLHGAYPLDLELIVLGQWLCSLGYWADLPLMGPVEAGSISKGGSQGTDPQWRAPTSSSRTNSAPPTMQYHWDWLRQPLSLLWHIEVTRLIKLK